MAEEGKNKDVQLSDFAASRRTMLAGFAAAPALAVASSGIARADANFETAFAADSARVRAALKGATGTKLVLLGTGGGPVPGQTRHMTSHLMLYDDAAYILDCGMGVTDQFARTGTPFSAVQAIFITHHHSDHNIEYGPFLVIGYSNGLRQSVRAYGPPPLQQLTHDFLRSYKVTLDSMAKPLGMIVVHDLATAGPVMQDDHVKVTSVLVQHPPATPAYGYRFDFPDRSIAFSGDTVPLEAVAQLARGADVLVHEAIDMLAMEQYFCKRSPATAEPLMHQMRASHSPTADVGRIAHEAGVKTLVLSHLSPSIGVSDEIWRADAARNFKGNIVVGHDLMVI